MRSLLVLAAVLTPAIAAADHAVYNLVDNRLAAHVLRGGGVVAVTGSAGFAKYLNGDRPNLPWKLGQKLDGKKVAIADNYTRLTLPVADPAKQLSVRLSSPKARDVEVRVDGKKVATAPVAAGWQTLKIPVDVAPGEVELQLIFGGKKGDNAVVEWVQLGGDPGGDAAPTFWDGGALLLPRDGGLAWYVQVPEGGKLAAEVAGDCGVGVRARPGSGKALEGVLTGAGASVDLAPLAGQIVRLELAPKGCDAKLKAAALTTGGPAPTVTRAKQPKNAIFWIMDSLRADRVRPFFPGARPEVPEWEKLAKKSTVFMNAYVQGNESRVSHASMWSSLLPVNHQMIPEKSVLDAKWTTLGEAMKATGRFTTGVSSNGWIIAKWGFGDGWDAYRNHIHQGGGTKAEDVWRESVNSLKGKSDKPWFLYMGTVDTHVSWRAHEPWISKYDTEPYDGPFKKMASDPDVDKIAAGKLKITERDKVRISALYDSDVSYQDDILGKVMAKLQEWGIADDTMVIITGDHGDEMWEDGRLGHGGSLHETLIHVPLIVYYPPLFPPGTVVTEGVDTIDILPTLTDAMGGKLAPEWQGDSLVALAQGVGRGYPRPSFGSQYEDAHAMRIGNWKIVERSSGQLRVFDAVKDHLEKADLAATRPVERRFLTDSFAMFLHYQKDWKKRRWGVASNVTAQFAEDVEK